MDSYSLYQDRIGQTLTTRLADAMEKEVISLEESSEIAQAILDGVQGSKNHEELMNFMEELAHKWPLFGPVLVSEQSEQMGHVVAEQEHQAVDQIEGLLKENKIDEAIQTAENATQETESETSNLEQPTQAVSEVPPTVPAEQTQQPAGQKSSGDSLGPIPLGDVPTSQTNPHNKILNTPGELPIPEAQSQDPSLTPPTDQNPQENPTNGGSQ